VEPARYAIGLSSAPTAARENVFIVGAGPVGCSWPWWPNTRAKNIIVSEPWSRGGRRRWRWATHILNPETRTPQQVSEISRA